MALDLEKFCAKAQTREQGGIKPGDSGVSCVDRVALRKEWARPGQASYWVDILRSSVTGETQVHRNWRWFNKKENAWVEGGTSCGKPSNSAPVTADTFQQQVFKQLEKGYVIDERQTRHRSPAKSIDFGKPRTAVRAAMATEEDDPTPAIYARKKGTHDWW
jgi:hypothetical protein